MTIIDQPLSLSLLFNIKPFKIGSTEKVSFVLKKGTDVIIQETYDPGTSGVVDIDVKDILSGYLSYIFIQTSDVYVQTNIAADFTATISGTEINFRVIRAGVDALADTPANFLKANFLTWQPNVKPVTYYQPEFLSYYAVENCTVKLVATMQDKSTHLLNLSDMAAGNAYTIPAQYGVIASKFTELPLYYDIYVVNASGERLTYIQRYYPTSALSEQEQWILFENSLGGMDTFRAYGHEEFTGEHTHNIAEINDVSEEYRIDTERKHKKNTGYLNEYERKWLLDFFPSKKKYIYTGSSVRAIVVTDSNVTYTDKELPSNFDFTYKYADATPYLNITRDPNVIEELNITLPDASSFTLPPRLIDFEKLPMTEGALFPVQSPFSEKWATTTAGALAEYFKIYLGSIDSGSGGVGHSHSNIDLLNALSVSLGYLLHNGLKINAGYADKAGSVDGFKELLSSFDSIFEIRVDASGYRTLHVKGSLYADGGVSSLGENTETGGAGITEEILADWLINNGYVRCRSLRGITDASGNIVETKTEYLARVPKADRYIGLEVVLKAESADETYTKFCFRNGIENYDFIGVEYFIDIKNYLYDGLDYEGDDKALSARQGKTLMDMINYWASGTY